MPENIESGNLTAVEAIDGAGKTTQVKKRRNALQQAGQPYMSIFCWSKADLQGIMRGIGGRWSKTMEGDYLLTSSVTHPGVEIRIQRDVLCQQ